MTPHSPVNADGTHDVKFRVVHVTRYHYAQPVTLCHNEVHLHPRSDTGQVCESSLIAIDPQPARFHQRTDYFGNNVAIFTVQEAHDKLTVTVDSVVRRSLTASAQADRSMPWDGIAARLRDGADEAAWAAREMVLESPLVPCNDALRDYALPSFAPGRPLLDAVADLVGRIHGEFAYTPQFTTVATPLSEVLRHRRGVCQDFAHLGVGCLRALGIPARYVSGYIESLPPPGGARLQGADASHAWFAVFDPDAGWIDFDPTNRQFVGERYVTTAWGRDYSDVSPLKGVVLGGGAHTLEVEVDMLALEA